MLKACTIAMGLIVALGACTSPQYNYKPSSSDISWPSLNVVTTVRVGESMVRQGRIVEIYSVRLDQKVSVGILKSYTFSPGYYAKVGSDAGSVFYLPEESPQGGKVVMGFADPFQAIQIMNEDDSWCGVSVYGGKACTSNVKFARLKRQSTKADGFQQTLIYSGRVGRRIKIGYREFSNNLARPAFHNEVEYDLSESRVIGYKGAEIEIITATNRDVQYKVISNFNKAVR